MRDSSHLAPGPVSYGATFGAGSACGAHPFARRPRPKCQRRPSRASSWRLARPSPGRARAPPLRRRCTHLATCPLQRRTTGRRPRHRRGGAAPRRTGRGSGAAPSPETRTGPSPNSCARRASARAGVETRFIVIADAAILESVQPWPSEPRFAELGAKGTCCTLASPDKSFEAHIFLAKVRHVALARSERGGRKIYAVRFFGEAAGARSGRWAAASTAHRRASRSRRRGSARRRGGEVGGARRTPPKVNRSETNGRGVSSRAAGRDCAIDREGARQLAK